MHKTSFIFMTCHVMIMKVWCQSCTPLQVKCYLYMFLPVYTVLPSMTKKQHKNTNLSIC